MKYIFLGGTGYLGQRLIKVLLTQTGVDIRAVIRSKEKQHNLSFLPPNRYLLASLYNKGDLNPEVVINLVANYGHNNDSSGVFASNVDYPLSEIKKLNPRCVINISTALPPQVSVYAQSKRELEERLIDWGLQVGAKIVTVRLQSFYGPSSPEHYFIAFLIRCMMANQTLPLTDCLQRRDFIFVDDVVRAIITIAENAFSLEEISTIEVGSGEGVQLKDLIHLLCCLTETSSQIDFGSINRRPFEPDNLIADISKIRHLGWTPRIPLLDGLAQTVRFSFMSRPYSSQVRICP